MVWALTRAKPPLYRPHLRLADAAARAIALAEAETDMLLWRCRHWPASDDFGAEKTIQQGFNSTL